MKLHLEKQFALADEPLCVMVSEAVPGAEVMLTASLTDMNGLEWRAWGRYHADSQGLVEPARCAAFEGSYLGVDGEGLIWSMCAQGLDHPDQSPPYPALAAGAAHKITVTASSSGSMPVEGCLARSWNGTDVTRHTVSDGNLVGVYHEPPASRRRKTGALVFTGSDGGINEQLAPLLAARGYPTLAIAYFGHPGLPRALAEVPLEYFSEASRWLRLRCERLCVLAISRGTEAALLSAASFETFADGLILFAPGHIVETGIDPSRTGSFGAWTFGGETIPFLPHSPRMNEVLTQGSQGRVITLTPVYLEKWQAAGAVAQYGIPVERIAAPVLMFSGANDQVWPASFAAEQIVSQMRAADPSARVEHIVYQGAGHAIVRPGVVASQSARTYHPHGQVHLDLGGLPAGNALASADALNRSLRFMALL